jgi:serine phosphatase RsbU (regulator of sigma subunit)
MPGIRIKLSVLFGLFVSIILAAATFFNYINQSRILEESFNNEIEISLRYINSAALSMESIRTNILLIEEMKLRIKEKREDLKQYRNFVYRKKDSVGNLFKSFGRKLGMDVRYDYYRKGYDTYYSIYLPEKEITSIEKRISEQLRHKDGSRITDKEFKALQKQAGVIAWYQRRIDALEKSIEAESSSKTKAAIMSKVKRERSRMAYAGKRFRNILNSFYEYTFSSLHETGTDSSNIRIITFSAAGDINYDTGSLIRDGLVKFSPLLKDKNYIKDRYSFFSSPDRAKNEDYATEYDYAISGNYYHVKYLPIFKNPSTYERLRLISDDIRENGSAWVPYLKEDLRISALIAGQSSKLRERLEYLKKNKTVPATDSEYRSLYDSYKKLLKERAAAFAKLAPYSDEMEKITDYYKEQIKSCNSETERMQTRIAQLKKETAPENKDEIKGDIESFQTLIDENRDRIKKLKYDMEQAREDIWQSEKLSSSDAMRFVRDAALIDFAILKQKNNPREYREYLGSSQRRLIESARFSTLREWIMKGESETGLPENVTGTKNTPLAGDGILAYSRSEIEEYMWLIDSTPVAGDIGIFSADTEGGLVSDLKGNSITGYNAVLIDKTDGVNKITSNRNMMILYSSLIALLSVILIYLLAGFMVKRIKKIIKQTALAGQGDLTVVFPAKGLDEIEELGVSLNSMIQGLREKEELKGEIAAAGEIQKILLPEKIPSTLEGYYSIGTFYRSMQGVGGDYYDIIELDESRIFFCIGDVSNHGVGPAIVMSMLRAHLHGIIKRGKTDLVEILAELNSQIFMETPPHIFVTFFAGIIDRNTNEIEYCSAGHLKPAVYRYKKGTVEILPGGGLPVGMDDNDFFMDTITVSSTKLSPGDLFFQYTDGASEAMNSSREQFGDERIFGEMKEYARKHPEVMITKIAESIERFTGKKIIETLVSELNDDIAMIAFKRVK